MFYKIKIKSFIKLCFCLCNYVKFLHGGVFNRHSMDVLLHDILLPKGKGERFGSVIVTPLW